MRLVRQKTWSASLRWYYPDQLEGFAAWRCGLSPSNTEHPCGEAVLNTNLATAQGVYVITPLEARVGGSGDEERNNRL
jgi:hypothetical protein